MKIHPLETHRELLILRKGELVIEALTRHAKDKGITNASFTGVGAVDQLRCGYYDLQNRSYVMQTYEQLCEVVSLTGNVFLKDGQPFVHAHGVFTNDQNNAFGGHIEEMSVGVTLEVILHKYETTVERTFDDETGLYLAAS